MGNTCSLIYLDETSGESCSVWMSVCQLTGRCTSEGFPVEIDLRCKGDCATLWLAQRMPLVAEELSNVRFSQGTKFLGKRLNARCWRNGVPEPVSEQNRAVDLVDEIQR